VKLAAMLGRAQGPPWSLLWSLVATWVEEEGKGRHILPSGRMTKKEKRSGDGGRE